MEEPAKEAPMLYANVGVHAPLYRLEQALQREIDSVGPEERDLILDWSQVKVTSTFSKNHHLGLYNCCTGAGEDLNLTRPRNVLIEWVLFSQFHEGGAGDERIGKLLALAGMLHCPKPKGFRVLDCLGFLPPQKSIHQRFGFVYPFPYKEGSTEAMGPITLRRLMEQGNFLITLGSKFKLAKALPSSLLSFIVTTGYTKTFGRFMLEKGPYLIGIPHSRPDSQKFYSDIPSTEPDPEVLLYQHPEYTHDAKCFQKAYDYYALGIVLLEVAFWHPIQAMWEKHGKSKALAGKAFQQKLIDKFFPKIPEVMANAYYTKMQP
ncbi:hypothetical protein B0J14DRAFT_690071 [Halenospora varia]|nr:hypothetical protein B0J14DRAFT_690071 [Halenospora varia]